MLRALPQAQLHVWEGMGHHPQRERPRELWAFIEDAAGGTGQELSALAGEATTAIPASAASPLAGSTAVHLSQECIFWLIERWITPEHCRLIRIN